ncbi:ABC transporter permease [Candidatus Aminicenantes bacterium AC-334-K16]|jgi:ABC-2 type transport system permease protein|nr:ABC transporter permease [Candidatus Aminicenantes bacterium AC-334-K16]
MNWSTIWTISQNDLKIAIKDKLFFFWVLVFPLLFAIIFGYAYPESTPQQQKVSLNIIDRDQSFLSAALKEALQAERFELQEVSEGVKITTRALIIPKGLAQRVEQGEKTDLILRVNPESNYQASQTAYVHVIKAVIRLLIRLAGLVGEGSGQITNFAESFANYHPPRLVSLRSEWGGQLRVMPSGFNHSIPAVTVMFILFTVLLYGGGSFQEERRRGQLERVLTITSFTSLFTGKWLSRLLLGLLQLILLFVTGKILFGFYYGQNIPALLLISILFCGSITGISLLLGSLIRQEEILIVASILMANLMGALGGCWWPIELVSPTMRTVSYLFPTGWIMDAYHKLIFFGASWSEIRIHFFVLGAFTLVFLFASIRFFRWKK